MKRFLGYAALACALIAARPATAHVTFFMDHFDQDPLANATSYPVPDTIVPLFAINGFLYQPGQIDYLKFSANAGDEFVGSTYIPLKLGAENFSPNFALIGPGLPAPAGATPFLVPTGDGAQIYSTPKDREIADEQFGYGALLQGKEVSVTLPADGVYYVAVYDPEGMLGHYILSVGSSEDETLIPDVERYTTPKFGDLNGDGKADQADVALILQSVVGKTTLNSRQRFSADVGPTGDSSRQLSPGDGAVDAGDASRLLRYAVGDEGGDNWPF
jgi:hypothetical protein